MSARSVSEHDGDAPSPQRQVDTPASDATAGGEGRSASGRANRAKAVRASVLGKSTQADGSASTGTSTGTTSNSAANSGASDDFEVEVVEIKSAGRSRRLPPVVRRRKPTEGTVDE